MQNNNNTAVTSVANANPTVISNNTADKSLASAAAVHHPLLSQNESAAGFILKKQNIDMTSSKDHQQHLLTAPPIHPNLPNSSGSGAGGDSSSKV